MNKCPNCGEPKEPTLTDTTNVNFKQLDWYECEDCNIKFDVFQKYSKDKPFIQTPPVL